MDLGPKVNKSGSPKATPLRGRTHRTPVKCELTWLGGAEGWIQIRFADGTIALRPGMSSLVELVLWRNGFWSPGSYSP